MKTPGENPGSSSSMPPESPAGPASAPGYTRPGLALGIASAGLVATAIVVLAHPLVTAAIGQWPGWAIRLTDLIVISAAFVVAVAVAAAVASTGLRRATGLDRWTWTDVLLGLAVAAVVRAAVEIVAPTGGGLEGPFQVEPTPDVIAARVVAIVGIVAVTPLVEELFFRGLLQRALQQTLGALGPAVAATIAVLASTGCFVLLHVLAAGAATNTALLIGTAGVGLGCGILTAVTGRLGGAIVAHVAFNTAGVVLLLV